MSDAARIDMMARLFAMEYLTGHYRPLRADEERQYDQLVVVMLAFAAQLRRVTEDRTTEHL